MNMLIKCSCGMQSTLTAPGVRHCSCGVEVEAVATGIGPVAYSPGSDTGVCQVVAQGEQQIMYVENGLPQHTFTLCSECGVWRCEGNVCGNCARLEDLYSENVRLLKKLKDQQDRIEFVKSNLKGLRRLPSRIDKLEAEVEALRSDPQTLGRPGQVKIACDSGWDD